MNFLSPIFILKLTSTTLLIMMMLGSPLLAAGESRIEAQLAEPPQPIPLRQVLGDAVIDAAIASGNYSYAGNTKCRLCHREFFIGRKQDAHDYAYKLLIKSGQKDNPRCLGCHTTGYGLEIGFINLDKTPRLSNVQCEGCHGPGSVHIKRREKGGFLVGTDQPKLLRKMCLTCHNERWNRSFDDIEESYKKYKNPLPG
jgi:hypothetical protein